jgi:death-on-curing protein
VLAAHQTALLMGGVDGVRDVGLLESAIARPYSGYHRPVSRKAALLHSLALNHGFVDGNKRTALLVLRVFLERSGYAIRLSRA